MPRIFPVLEGTMLSFYNQDSDIHHVYTKSSLCDAFDLGELKSNHTATYATREQDAAAECLVQCRLHDDLMHSIGYAVILKNPYYTLTGEGGTFEIPHIPMGRYSVATWGEHLQSEDRQNVHIESGKETYLVIDMHWRQR